jgi:hypothetical protein
MSWAILKFLVFLTPIFIPGLAMSQSLTVSVTTSAYTDGASNSATHTVTWPMLSTGERLIAAVVSDGNPAITMPAGFVSRGAVNRNQAAKAQAFEYDFDSNGQPSGAITLSNSQRIQVTMFVVSGHDPVSDHCAKLGQ